MRAHLFLLFFMMSLQMAGQNTFLALGRSKQAIFFSLLRKAIIVVPLVYILPRIGRAGRDGRIPLRAHLRRHRRQRVLYYHDVHRLA